MSGSNKIAKKGDVSSFAGSPSGNSMSCQNWSSRLGAATCIGAHRKLAASFCHKSCNTFDVLDENGVLAAVGVGLRHGAARKTNETPPGESWEAIEAVNENQMGLTMTPPALRGGSSNGPPKVGPSRGPKKHQMVLKGGPSWGSQKTNGAFQEPTKIRWAFEGPPKTSNGPPRWVPRGARRREHSLTSGPLVTWRGL